MNQIVSYDTEDIPFWNYQFMEHCLFLKKLLSPEKALELKEEAKRNYQNWENFLQSDDSDKPNIRLLNSLYSLLGKILNKIKTGKIINIEIPSEDFKSLVKHMLLEQNYFVSLIDGTLTLEQEFLFWLKETQQHTQLVSDLLEPGKIKKEAKRLAKKLKQDEILTNQDFEYFFKALDDIETSLKSGIDIVNKIENGKVKTVDKKMLEHELRETLRLKSRLREYY